MLKAYLARTSLVHEDILKYLSEEEIAKANRYKIEDDKIRSLLSSYLLKYVLKDNNVDNYNIIVNEFGKPYLEGNKFYFNISHSHDFVVCAISNKEVGIDIEKVRPVNELVLNKCFTNEEKDFVKNEQDFIKVWTLKESYIKHIGTGLKTKLNSFSVISNQNLNRLNDLMFTSLKVEDYQMSICHHPFKHFQLN